MVQLVGLVQVVKLRSLLTEISHLMVLALVSLWVVCDLGLLEIVAHLVRTVLVARSYGSFVSIAVFECWGVLVATLRHRSPAALS